MIEKSTLVFLRNQTQILEGREKYHIVSFFCADCGMNDTADFGGSFKALGMRNDGIKFVSCPTCGRTEIDLIGLADKVEKAVSHIKKPIKLAVMGCAVNGPGEAREADIGVAGGDGCGLIFKKGEIIKKLPESELLAALLDEIERL